VAVGFRQDIASNPIYSQSCPGYGIELWAGGVLLCSNYYLNLGNSVPAAGTWKDVIATYTAGPDVTPGQQLQIRLRGYGIQTNYDRVRLTAETLTMNDSSSYISNPVFGIDTAKRGFASDPDRDGIGNGLEAYFGTHPGMLSKGIVAGTNNNGAGIFNFTHPKSPSPQGVHDSGMRRTPQR
jgi:hypothetical protein